MNILLIHNYNVEDQNKEVLFAHVFKWAKKNSNIWILSKEENVSSNTVGVKSFQLSKLQPTTISVSLWEKINDHPNFDLVIDASKNIPYKSSYLSKIKTVYYFSKTRFDFLKNLNKKIVKRTIPLLFNSKYFMFDENIKNNDVSAVFKDKKYESFYLEHKKRNTKRIKVSRKTGIMNLIYIDTRSKLRREDEIFQVFTNIVRKNEGWNLIIFTNNKTNLSTEFDINHPLHEFLKNIIIYKLGNPSSIFKKIPSNSLIIDLLTDKEKIVEYLIYGSYHRIPFLLRINSNKIFFNNLKNKKQIFLPLDPNVTSEMIANVVKSNRLMDDVRTSENEWAKSYKDKDVFEDSFNFLENI